MKPILLDVDGVIADFVGALCELLKCNGVALSVEDVKCWDLAELSKSWPEDDRKTLNKLITQTDGYTWHDLIQPYPGSRAFVNRLSNFGKREVLYVTSPLGVPSWHNAREDWLQQHFGAKRDQIIFAHSAAKKHVAGAMLIEDRYDTCLNWVQQDPTRKAYVLARPWNTNNIGPQSYRYSHHRVKLAQIYGDVE